MKETRRHPQYWTVRFMLAFAIVALPAALYWLAAMQPATMGGHTASPGLDWVGGSILAVGAGLWFAGVIWMIRIFRGPSDDSPPWRYRVR
jgi:hypothetical protein